jgi:hypothetical protein
MIDVNVRALVELTHGVLPGMVKRRSGAIVSVASNAAFQPVPYMSVYAASKAFVLSFTEGLANELRGTGVRVQALCPGVTATEFLQVADTHSLPVARMPMLTSDEVVAASLRGLDRGKLRVVVGFANRVLAALVPLTPGAVARAVGERLFKPNG